HEHALRFTLKRKHTVTVDGAPTRIEAEFGRLVDYSPRNVVKEQTYNAKIAGGLKTSSKATEKGVETGSESSLSGEISTSYTFKSVNIVAREGDNGLVGFEISHDINQSPFSSTGIYSNVGTTIATMRGSYWALYQFERDSRDTQDNAGLILEVHEQSGSFGQYQSVVYGGGQLIGDALRTHRYSIHDHENPKLAYTVDFSLPHFSLGIANRRGEPFVAPPGNLDSPLKLKPGQDFILLIDAGGSPSGGTQDPSRTHPIALSWQTFSLPASFTMAPDSGNQKTEVRVFVKPDAKVGEKNFLRFNSKPTGAAPGLQTGDLAIPYEIVVP
ncbi:MAG: hypothetical protein AB7E55_26600, partial [Pigmentiphaga sp.]